MKRFHINLCVSDLEKSITFYNSLFAQEPTVAKPDYAKWMLEDPRINFSITTHGSQKGIDHVGLQSDDKEEFEALRDRLQEADLSTFEQPDVVCCYARSSKSWVRDPDEVAWETFVSHGTSSLFDHSAESDQTHAANQQVVKNHCCVTSSEQASCCHS